MKDYKLEDTVILIDTSRSMLRRDFKPNRLTVALKTAKKFIEQKLSIDPKDRIAIVTFGDEIKKLASFSYEYDSLINSLEKIQISGNGLVNDGIAFALQLLVEEMRKIGGKFNRIFIVSDDKVADDSIAILKMIKIAKGLNVFIDCCQLGEPLDYRESNLEKIAQMTNGEFGYFNNSKAIINAGSSFASKKDVSDPADYFSKEKKDEAPLLNDIALKLRRPTVLEIRMMMDGKMGQKKCQICHSTKAPITNADFYAEGRFCPSCERAMHLSCAAMWAKKSEYKENVFRCPFCFFLLEVPESIVKVVEKNIKKDKGDGKIKIIPEEDDLALIMTLIPKNDIDDIDASCTYCNSIFMGNYKVFRCVKCGSFYHEPCLKKMYDELKACRYCGTKFDID